MGALLHGVEIFTACENAQRVFVHSFILSVSGHLSVYVYHVKVYPGNGELNNLVSAWYQKYIYL